MATGKVSEYATDVTTSDAIAVWKALPEPRFMVVSYNAAHAPFAAPPGAQDPGTKLGRFLLMVENLDGQLGRLLDECPSDYTIILSDNGTPSNVSDHPGESKSKLNEPGVNTLLVVCGPGVVPGRTQALAQVSDIYATVLDLVGTMVVCLTRLA